ncbi:MAG: hypothetical protein JW919_02715 [Candidatus Omnitrophica bacterium]|nr:hypothetical protein [Candidatus Omnitrophota bacterium]
MKLIPKKLKTFFMNILHSALGISEEAFLAYLFIVIGCIICFVWWRALR